jgi:leucine-rich repeat protein SHOC2
MTPYELEQIIDKAKIDRDLKLYLSESQLTDLPESIGDISSLTHLYLRENQLSKLPKSIGNLSNLTHLNLIGNQLTSLPESIGNLSNLTHLYLANNKLNCLPENISNLSKLTYLHLSNNQLTVLPRNIGSLTNLNDLDLLSNQLTSLPESIGNLSSLKNLDLSENPLTDFSILQNLHHMWRIRFLNLYPPQRYWTKMSEWKAEWLLDEVNVEIKQLLIEHIGYEKICRELNASKLDDWREYGLLKIDDFEKIYDDYDYEIDREPMLLIKMTCPSTNHIHILRVPPDITSAEAAITWVNHGIHPDEFVVQT